MKTLQNILTNRNRCRNFYNSCWQCGALAELMLDAFGFTVWAFSALTLLVWCQEEHLSCKNEWWGEGVVTLTLTPYLCGYCTTSSFNLSRFLLSIASSLQICWVWQSFSITSLPSFLWPTSTSYTFHLRFFSPSHSVTQCFFWYWLTRVVPDKGP